jgi:hypothetical protein
VGSRAPCARVAAPNVPMRLHGWLPAPFSQGAASSGAEGSRHPIPSGPRCQLGGALCNSHPSVDQVPIAGFNWKKKNRRWPTRGICDGAAVRQQSSRGPVLRSVEAAHAAVVAPWPSPSTRNVDCASDHQFGI